MAKQPTAEQKRRWQAVRELGCIVELENEFRRCCSPAEIHHIHTGSGGRRDHDFVIPLCHFHHSPYGEIGIHRIGRRKWQEIYGTEEELFEKVNELLTK